MKLKDRLKILAFAFMPDIAPVKREPAASVSGNYRNVFSVSYNGEKNLGEIGPIRDYYIDYEARD